MARALPSVRSPILIPLRAALPMPLDLARASPSPALRDWAGSGLAIRMPTLPALLLRQRQTAALLLLIAALASEATTHRARMGTPSHSCGAFVMGSDPYADIVISARPCGYPVYKIANYPNLQR